MTNDEMLIATHNHKRRIRQNPLNNLWYVHRKEMLRVGKFDWVIESGPHDTKAIARKARMSDDFYKRTDKRSDAQTGHPN
jgi:hypothetical protein